MSFIQLTEPMLTIKCDGCGGYRTHVGFVDQEGAEQEWSDWDGMTLFDLHLCSLECALKALREHPGMCAVGTKTDGTRYVITKIEKWYVMAATNRYPDSYDSFSAAMEEAQA